MQNPNNLRVTAQARSLAVHLYRATAQFPASERFGLTAQMRRAAVSIGSNMAEGCGRSGDRELVHFLHIALGSASELEFQLLLCVELKHLSGAQAQRIAEQVADVKRMLAGLIKSLRKPSEPGARSPSFRSFEQPTRSAGERVLRAAARSAASGSDERSGEAAERVRP